MKAWPLFLVAALASKLENRDPSELPIFQYINERFPDLDWRAYRQAAFTPFDPVRKRTEAQIEKGTERFVVMKGAAQVLLGTADLPEAEALEINRTVGVLAGKGLSHPGGRPAAC